MPTARAPTLTLALLSLFGRSSGIEDVAALIQQRQAVEALEAAPSELARLVPNVGADGVYFRRISAIGEPGSSILLNYSKDYWNICDQEDSWGPKECGLYFGTTFHQTFKIHLPGGLSSGDVLSQSWTIALDHNTSSLLAFLVPDDFIFTSRHGVCENSSHYSSTEATYSLNVTMPNHLPEMCSSNGDDFVIANKTTFWFRPPMGLKLKGDLNMSTGVFDKDGNVRARASYLYRMSGAGAPTTLAADVGGAALEEKGERLAMPPMEAAGFFREVLFGGAGEAAEAVGTSAGGGSAGLGVSLAEFFGSASKMLVLNLTVKDLAPGNSVAFSADKGCNATDSNGSIACEFSLDENVTFTSAVDISFTAAEGSTMYAASKVNVGGNFGIIIGKKFKKKEMTVPLCGANATVTDAKGLTHNYQPGKCGYYAFEFRSSAQEFKNMADIVNIPLPQIPLVPFLPKTLNDLMPLSQVAELKLKNADNSTILWIEVGFGLKTL